MGYKPGTTLGKEGSNAIAEPLPLPVKLGRKGVGHDVEEQSEAKEKIDQHIRAMKEAAAQQTELLHDYRKRKRVTVDTKQVIGDIMKMRKACQELDVTAGLELPTVSWHWPIYKDRTGEIHNEPAPFKRRQPGAEEEDEEDAKFIYANGKEAPGNERFDELAEEELTDRLFQFSLYLREKHLYCHWCGAKFDDADQLGEQCPGNSRDAHE
uniref:G patch domain-containing protein 11 n=1 Tax=Panagrellus redivivus TaxID=6233 RepID=A0A7E4WCF9_PANRE